MLPLIDCELVVMAFTAQAINSEHEPRQDSWGFINALTGYLGQTNCSVDRLVSRKFEKVMRGVKVPFGSWTSSE